MAVLTTAAFKKHRVTRTDGLPVLPKNNVFIAALEAGYHFPSPIINDAISNAKHPDQFTLEEFTEFCERNPNFFVTPQDMAKAVVIVASSNIITRGSLERIINQSNTQKSALSEEEIDSLFCTLDTENKGVINAEDFMRELYGEEGALCLAEQRMASLKEAKDHERKMEEEKRIADEKARQQAEALREAEARREKEAAAKREEDAKMQARSAELNGSKKKKKASACC